MLARHEAIVSAGPMDERYFMYCEEPGLCLGLTRMGWNVRQLPAITIVHHPGKAGWSGRLMAQQAYARRQYELRKMSRASGRLSRSALTLGHLLCAGYFTPDADLRRARRSCSRAALLALFGLSPPPSARRWPEVGPQPGDAETRQPAVACSPLAE